jgi:hypothetical protein
MEYFDQEINFVETVLSLCSLKFFIHVSTAIRMVIFWFNSNRLENSIKGY